MNSWPPKYFTAVHCTVFYFNGFLWGKQGRSKVFSHQLSCICFFPQHFLSASLCFFNVHEWEHKRCVPTFQMTVKDGSKSIMYLHSITQIPQIPLQLSRTIILLYRSWVEKKCCFLLQNLLWGSTSFQSRKKNTPWSLDFNIQLTDIQC